MHLSVMAAQGRLEDALRIAQKALGLAPGTPVNLETGEIHMAEMSDTEKANIAQNEAEGEAAPLAPETVAEPEPVVAAPAAEPEPLPEPEPVAPAPEPEPLIVPSVPSTEPAPATEPEAAQ